MRSSTDPLPINEWPDARSIIYDTGGKPASVLRGFLKKFQHRAFFFPSSFLQHYHTVHVITDAKYAVEKPADKVPLWQSTLSALPKPDYSPSVGPEWEYLRALGRSSLLDFAVYEEFRGGKGSLAAQNLSKVDQSYADIVARNEATFKSTIPAEWQNSDATKRYMSDLDYYSSLWYSTRVLPLCLSCSDPCLTLGQQSMQRRQNSNSPVARCQTYLIAFSAMFRALLSLRVLPSMATSLPTWRRSLRAAQETPSRSLASLVPRTCFQMVGSWCVRRQTTTYNANENFHWCEGKGVLTVLTYGAGVH